MSEATTQDSETLERTIAEFAKWCGLDVVAPDPLRESARWILRADPKNDPDWRDGLWLAQRCLGGNRATVAVVEMGEATTNCGRAQTVYGLTVTPRISVATQDFWGISST
jgi:hypothetical protein